MRSTRLQDLDREITNLLSGVDLAHEAQRAADYLALIAEEKGCSCRYQGAHHPSPPIDCWFNARSPTSFPMRSGMR